MNPINAALFKSPMTIKIVCPIIYEAINYEVDIRDIREFVKKSGPILLISIRILQIGMMVGKFVGMPLPSIDLFPVDQLKSMMALNKSNNLQDKLITLALNKISDVINQNIDQSLSNFSIQLDACCLNPVADVVSNIQIHSSLQSINDANYKEFYKLCSSPSVVYKILCSSHQ